MDLGWTNATAAVTGGSSGMGRAAAECIAADGARVAVFARGAAQLEETVAALRERGSPDAVGISLDVTDARAVESVFAELGERWGSLNALVNTVGPGDTGTIDTLSEEGWSRSLELGLMSGVRCTRAALPWLRKAEWARIVNVSAHSTPRQAPTLIGYTAAKSALTSVSTNLAKTLAPVQILVNTVSPGTFLSAAFTENLRPILEPKGIDPEDPYAVNQWIAKEYGEPADLGRAGRVEEIGPVIA